MKKLMALTLSFVMIFTMMPMTAAAEVGGTNTRSQQEFTDMPQGWATDALINAVDNGLLTGFDGKIMPSENLTRSQMAAIINRSFGASVKGSLTEFTDVDSSVWYYDEMAKAVQMKTFMGTDGKLNPNAPITREEAFVVLARAFKLGTSNVAPAGFLDLENISTWAKGEVYSLINAGYIAGSNGYINPKNNITRAEFSKVMDNVLKVYIKEAGEYTTLPEGNVMVNVAGVTLKDVTIDGDLIVGDGVGDGDLILDNVTINGRMVARGGGENSIIIRGESKVGKLIVARVDGAIRIFAEDGSEIEAIHLDDGQDMVTLEGSIGELVIQADVPVALVNATIGNVTVEAANAQVTVDKDSKVEKLVISEAAEESNIEVEGIVKEVVVEAPKTTIEGEGTVEKVLATSTSSDSTFTTTKTTITTEKGAEGITGTGGTKIPEGTKAENGSTTDKPAVVEEPKTTKPSTGGSGGGGGSIITAIKLNSASLNNVAADINNNTITVNFVLGTAPGEIKAEFNKPVTITKVSSDKFPTISLDEVSEKVGKTLPSTSSTLTLPISTVITQDHLTTFGSIVTVTVKDSDNQTATFTIELSGHNKP